MTDRYTKAILTIIAACLVILVLRGHVTPAGAQYQGIPSPYQYQQQQPQPVHFYVDGDVMDVRCQWGCRGN
jgi:hypothetical protein